MSFAGVRNFGENCYGEGIKEHNFSPYESNEGSIVAIAGDDFVVIASDTRLSEGYSILSRNQPKLFQLSKMTILGTAGCWCDALSFSRILEARMKMYLHEHNRVMSTPAVSQLISSMMYYKRFFPYYVSNLLAGLDLDGKGWVYSYDSIGHREKAKYRAAGSSCQLLQPILDNLVGGMNMEGLNESSTLSLEQAVAIVKDTFISASERDIYTGDEVVINVITKDGIAEQNFQLRHD